jgi:hypothetical protein
MRIMFKWMVSMLFWASFNCAADAGYRPEIFKKVEPVYIDQFDKDGKVNRAFWQVKQKTVWVVKDGMLVGSPSSREYQEHVRTEGDGIHTGANPVIILKPVPEEFVLRMRIKYEGDAKAVKIDIGHHINSFIFTKESTRMKFNKKATAESAIAFPVNTWGELTFEFKEGKLLFGVNGEKEVIEKGSISMADSLQVDIKGISQGRVLIDWIELYRGVE